eukprot:4062759-Pyramimonas_sp.AAC.1
MPTRRVTLRPPGERRYLETAESANNAEAPRVASNAERRAPPFWSLLVPGAAGGVAEHLRGGGGAGAAEGVGGGGGARVARAGPLLYLQLYLRLYLQLYLQLGLYL